MYEVILESSELARSNFNRSGLRVAAVISEEYSYDTLVYKLPDGSFRFGNSFAVELLRALEETMNFTGIPVITEFWGHLLPNNTWVGMIALLLKDEADLGLSSIADRPFRRKVVDFNIPTNQIRLAAYFQKPAAIAPHPTALFLPFQSLCWVLVGLMLIVLMLTAFYFNNAASSNEKIVLSNENMAQDQEERWSFSDCFLFAVTTITFRGFPYSASTIPLRITLIAGMLAGVVLFAAYSGTLVSFLSVATEPIMDLAQLLASRFRIAVIQEPLAFKFLSESPDLRTATLYRDRITEKNYSSLTDAYKEMNKGGFVFVSPHPGAYSSLSSDFSVEEACRIREIEIPNGGQQQGTLVQKNSPYKRIIDYQILRTIQYGLVKRWSLKFLKRRASCESPISFEGVDLKSSIAAFAIVAMFGWALGFILLLYEVKMSRMKGCCGQRNEVSRANERDKVFYFTDGWMY